MSENNRSEIEKRIQESSLQSEENLLELARLGKEQMPDMVKLEKMLFEWKKLADYYVEHNYTGEFKDADLNISILITKNYLHWAYSLQNYMAHYSRQGKRKEAEEFDEALNTLENEMKRIIDSVDDFDKYK